MDIGVAFQVGIELIQTLPENGRCQQRPHRVDAAIVVTMFGIGIKAGRRILNIADADNQRIAWQMVEQGSHLLEKQRLPIFDTGGQGAFADLLIDVFRIATDFKLLAPATAKSFDGIFIGWKFARR